jgi:hypothetical protein
VRNVRAALDGLRISREFPARHAQRTEPVDQITITRDEADGIETDARALARLIEHAELHFDGHFTLLRFTTDWRCILGTMQPNRPAIQRMPSGRSLSETVSRAIRHGKGK